MAVRALRDGGRREMVVGSPAVLPRLRMSSFRIRHIFSSFRELNHCGSESVGHFVFLVIQWSANSVIQFPFTLPGVRQKENLDVGARSHNASNFD